MGITHQGVSRIERDGSAPQDTLDRYAAAVSESLLVIIDAARVTRSVKNNYQNP